MKNFNLFHNLNIQKTLQRKWDTVWHPTEIAFTLEQSKAFIIIFGCGSILGFSGLYDFRINELNTNLIIFHPPFSILKDPSTTVRMTNRFRFSVSPSLVANS